MTHIPNRSIQAANILFSSSAIFLLIVGFIMENWVELVPKVRKDKTTHSPWLGCCPPFWPEGQNYTMEIESLDVVKRMMMMTLNIAIYLNLIIGLQYTYMLSQNKCVHLFVGFLSFFEGCLLFYAIIVYHHKLNEGQYVYFVNYKTKWIAFTVYLTIALFLTCGIFCFIQSTNRCACMKFCIPHTESKSQNPTQSTIQVISLPPRTAMPRSIVHVHSVTSKEAKSHLQARRVTWAL